MGVVGSLGLANVVDSIIGLDLSPSVCRRTRGGERAWPVDIDRRSAHTASSTKSSTAASACSRNVSVTHCKHWRPPSFGDRSELRCAKSTHAIAP